MKRRACTWACRFLALLWWLVTTPSDAVSLWRSNPTTTLSSTILSLDKATTTATAGHLDKDLQQRRWHRKLARIDARYLEEEFPPDFPPQCFGPDANPPLVVRRCAAGTSVTTYLAAQVTTTLGQTQAYFEALRLLVGDAYFQTRALGCDPQNRRITSITPVAGTFAMMGNATLVQEPQLGLTLLQIEFLTDDATVNQDLLGAPGTEEPEPETSSMCEAAVDVQPTNGLIVFGSTQGFPALQADEAAANCQQGNFLFAPGQSRVAYYEFVGDGNVYQVSTRDSFFDTALGLLRQTEGQGCDILTTTCVTINDDFQGLQSQIEFIAEEGVQYWLLVGGFATSQGDFRITWTDVMVSSSPSFAPRPPNTIPGDLGPGDFPVDGMPNNGETTVGGGVVTTVGGGVVPQGTVESEFSVAGNVDREEPVVGNVDVEEPVIGNVDVEEPAIGNVDGPLRRHLDEGFEGEGCFLVDALRGTTGRFGCTRADCFCSSFSASTTEAELLVAVNDLLQFDRDCGLYDNPNVNEIQEITQLWELEPLFCYPSGRAAVAYSYLLLNVTTDPSLLTLAELTTIGDNLRDYVNEQNFLECDQEARRVLDITFSLLAPEDQLVDNGPPTFFIAPPVSRLPTMAPSFLPSMGNVEESPAATPAAAPAFDTTGSPTMQQQGPAAAPAFDTTGSPTMQQQEGPIASPVFSPVEGLRHRELQTRPVGFGLYMAIRYTRDSETGVTDLFGEAPRRRLVEQEQNRELVTLFLERESRTEEECFCPRFGPRSGDSVSLSSFIGRVNLELINNARETRLINSVGLREIECPNDDFVPFQQTIYVGFTNEVSRFSIGDLETLGADCLDAYNRLAVSSGAQTIAESCVVSPIVNNREFAGLRGRRMLRATPTYLRFDITGRTRENDIFVGPMLVRRLESKQQHEANAFEALSASTVDPLRQLQETEVVCLCPTNIPASSCGPPSLEEFAFLINSFRSPFGLVVIDSMLLVEEQECGQPVTFQEVLPVLLIGDLETFESSEVGERDLAAIVIEEVNRLSLESCPLNYVFVTQADLTVSPFRPREYELVLSGVTYDAGLETFARNLDRRLKQETRFRWAGSNPFVNHHHVERSRQLDEVVINSPCLCLAGSETNAPVELDELENRINSELFLERVDGLQGLLIVGEDDVLFDRQMDCPATNVTFDAYFGLTLGSATPSLTEMDRRLLELALHYAYVNATSQSCDAPFYRTILQLPELDFPLLNFDRRLQDLENILEPQDDLLVFRVGISSRGEPPFLAATTRDFNQRPRRLQEGTNFGICSLEEIVLAPTVTQCSSEESLPNFSFDLCECPRDGCYCPPRATSFGGATETEVLQAFTDSLSVINTLPGAERFIPNRKLQSVTNLEATELTELRRVECSGFNTFDVLITFYISSAGGMDLTNPEFLSFLATSLESSINEESFETCDSSFTRITNVTIVEAVAIGEEQEQQQEGSPSTGAIITASGQVSTTNATIFGQGARRSLKQSDTPLAFTRTTNSDTNKRRKLVILPGGDGIPSCFCPVFTEGLGEPVLLDRIVELVGDDISREFDAPIDVEDASVGEVQQCPNRTLEELTTTFILTLLVPLDTLTQQDFDDLELACVLEYARLDYETSCDDTFINVVGCTVSTIDSGGLPIRRLQDQGDRKLSYDSGLLLTLRGTGYPDSRSDSGDPYFGGFRRRMEELVRSRVVDRSLSWGLHPQLPGRRRLQTTEGSDVCICPAGDDGEDAVDFQEYVAALNNTVPIRTGNLVEERDCSDIEFFEADLPLEVDSDLSNLTATDILFLEQLLLEVYNQLSLEQCPDTFVFIFDVTITIPPVEPERRGLQLGRRSILATYTGRCSTGALSGSRSCQDSVFTGGFRRRLSSKLDESLVGVRGGMDEVGSLGVESVSSPIIEYRRQERRLEDFEFFTCYCVVGSEVGGDIDLMEYNEMLEEELPNYVDPELVAFAEVGFEPLGDFEFVTPCEATNVTFDTFLGISIAGMTAALSAEDRQDLELALAAAYVNATLSSCDEPFYRTLDQFPTLEFPMVGNGGRMLSRNLQFIEEGFLLFSMSIASRGEPPFLAALDPSETSGTSLRERELRQLQTTEVCFLEEIVFGPYLDECIAQSIAPEDCICRRDGCYCSPDATTFGGATEADLFQALNFALLNLTSLEEFDSNRTRRLVGNPSDESDGYFGRSLQFTSSLELLDLTELRQLNCSGFNTFEILVTLIISNAGGVDFSAPDVRAFIEEAIVTAFNEENFESCDSSFTRISDVAVADVLLLDSLGRRLDEGASSSSQRRAQRGSSSGAVLSLTGRVTSTGTDFFDGFRRRRFLKEPRNHLTQKRRRKLVTVEDENGDPFCFCPRFVPEVGEPITVEVLVDLLQFAVSDEFNTTIDIADAAITEVEECPDVPLIDIETQFLMTLGVDTATLSQADLEELEQACVLEYARLNADTCDGLFTTATGCTIVPYNPPFGETSSRRSLSVNHRRLGFDSLLLVTVTGTQYMSNSSIPADPFFGSSRRRLDDGVNDFEKSTDHRFLGQRQLQANLTDDICSCPFGVEIGGEPTDFDTYISALSNTIPIRAATLVEERFCIDWEVATVEVDLQFEGDRASLDPESIASLEQLLKDSFNKLTLEECPIDYVFVEDVVITVEDENIRTPPGVIEAVAAFTVGFTLADDRGIPPPVGGTPQGGLEDFPTRSRSETSFLRGFRRALRSMDDVRASSVRVRNGAFSAPFLVEPRDSRDLQSSSSNLPCLCEVGAMGNGTIELDVYNFALQEQLPNYIEAATVTSAQVVLIEDVPPQCRCEFDGEDVYPRPMMMMMDSMMEKMSMMSMAMVMEEKKMMMDMAVAKRTDKMGRYKTSPEPFPGEDNTRRLKGMGMMDKMTEQKKGMGMRPKMAVEKKGVGKRQDPEDSDDDEDEEDEEDAFEFVIDDDGLIILPFGEMPCQCPTNEKKHGMRPEGNLRRPYMASGDDMGPMEPFMTFAVCDSNDDGRMMMMMSKLASPRMAMGGPMGKILYLEQQSISKPRARGGDQRRRRRAEYQEMGSMMMMFQPPEDFEVFVCPNFVPLGP